MHGAGADVEHVVGEANGVLVMLDHDRCCRVAQPLQRFQQPRVVALVQADRGLVEAANAAGQPGADLEGQPVRPAPLPPESVPEERDSVR